MAYTNPASLVRQVRQEVRKVVWPSRKETGVSTIMVVVMAVIMAVFFMLVDQFFAWAVGALVG